MAGPHEWLFDRNQPNTQLSDPSRRLGGADPAARGHRWAELYGPPPALLLHGGVTPTHTPCRVEMALQIKQRSPGPKALPHLLHQRMFLWFLFATRGRTRAHTHAHTNCSAARVLAQMPSLLWDDQPPSASQEPFELRAVVQRDLTERQPLVAATRSLWQRPTC